MSEDAVTLAEEISLLERSLADARDEHARGDLDDAGLAAIEQRDGARLDAARTRLEAVHDPAPDAPAPDAPAPGAPAPGAPAPVAPAPDTPTRAGTARSRRRPRSLLYVGIACLAAVGLVLGLTVAHPFRDDPPAQHVSSAEKIAGLRYAAQRLLSEHRFLAALTAFDALLELRPLDPEALVESAWLRYEYEGLGRHDAAQVRLGYDELGRAVRLAPRNAAAHLYDGIAVCQVTRDVTAAKAQVVESARLSDSLDQVGLATELLRYLDAPHACQPTRR